MIAEARDKDSGWLSVVTSAPGPQHRVGMEDLGLGCAGGLAQSVRVPEARVPPPEQAHARVERLARVWR